MRKIATLAAALMLGACTTMPPSRGIQAVGDDTFMVSEISGYGNVVQRAARFCNSFGQSIDVQGNTTQTGITGTSYPVLVFRCV